MSDVETGAFALPTGTVTFLVGEVRPSATSPDASAVALTEAAARGEELLDAAIDARDGVRPAGRRAGRRVVAVFGRPSDALAAAVAVRRALAAERWPAGARSLVRIALHTGEAQRRDERSYFGDALDRCARIGATGHDGQVLLSSATAELVRDRLPDGTTLHDLGWHRLTDLGRPEHIWQVGHAGMPSGFPPLRSLDAFPHNLPVQLTPLIGRQAETADVRGLLDRDRMVTLSGSAGVGKTRLALSVAAESIDRYPGGVWWLDLAPLDDEGAVGRTALAAVGAREASGEPVAEQLAVALGEQPALIVMDNCEHLIGACSELAAQLLAASPTASVLATSREPLGVPGEITWRVPSLRCPGRARPVQIPALSHYDAVVLFVERARRARPPFVVDEANAPAIAEICHRLDGIPLAIELAAARCRQMAPQHIAIELDDRFRLLTGGARTVLPRQQTLGASIDWSHDRLDEAERIAFRRLGVLAGPFPLAAAEALVATEGEIEPAEVFDLMTRLVDKNLVVTGEDRSGEPRYRLLESLRAYALDRADADHELTDLRDAHAAWWAGWLEPRGVLPTDELLDEFEEFHPNLKAALDWSVDRPRLGLQLLGGVARAWWLLGWAGDAMSATDRLLTDANAELDADLWLAVALDASNLVLAARGPADATALLERIEAVAVRRGDEVVGRLARWPKGELPVSDPEWRRRCRERRDPYLDAWVPLMLAWTLAEDEPAAAVPVIEDVRAVATASGMRSLRALAALAEAELACSTGDLDTAIRSSLELLQGPWNAEWGNYLRLVSFAALLAEDEDALLAAIDAAERWSHSTPGESSWTGLPRHRLGLLRGQPVVPDTSIDVTPTCSTLWLTSRELIEAGRAHDAIERARPWARPEPHPRAVGAAIEAAATGDEDRWHDALAIALDQGLRPIAVDALEGLAVAAWRVESPTECLRLLGAAARLRDETGYSWRFDGEQQAVAVARADAAEALGDSAEQAESDGRDLDWRRAASYARRARGDRKRPHHGWASLTPTEQQVVVLVAEGLTNPQIADRLLMGRATVKTHLEHIFTKLDIHTRAELAAQATRRAMR
jgi:predicted ATPase/DNA-binding CsgD family transcriptional regulator